MPPTKLCFPLLRLCFVFSFVENTKKQLELGPLSIYFRFCASDSRAFRNLRTYGKKIAEIRKFQKISTSKQQREGAIFGNIYYDSLSLLCRVPLISFHTQVTNRNMPPSTGTANEYNMYVFYSFLSKFFWNLSCHKYTYILPNIHIYVCTCEYTRLYISLTYKCRSTYGRICTYMSHFPFMLNVYTYTCTYTCAHI